MSGLNKSDEVAIYAKPTDTPPSVEKNVKGDLIPIWVDSSGRQVFTTNVTLSTYLTNPDAIKVSLSAGDILISVDDLEALQQSTINAIAASNTKLDSLTAKDYATESTLSNVANSIQNVDNTLGGTLSTFLTNPDAIKVSLSAGDILISVDDLEALQQSTIDAINITNTRLDVLTAAIDGESTAANQAIQITKLDALTAKDFATESTLTSMADNVSDIENLVTLTNTHIVDSNTRLNVLTGVDYATESTLVGMRADVADLENAQDLTNDKLTQVNSQLDALTSVNYATEATQLSISTNISDIENAQIATNNILTRTNNLLQALTAVSPSGTTGATEVKQDIQISHLASLTSRDFATEATLQAIDTSIQSVDTNVQAVNTTLGGTLTTYLVNPDDIKVSLSAGDILISVDDLEALQQSTIDAINLGNAKLDTLTAANAGNASAANQVITHTKLDTLTGIDYATSAKQDIHTTRFDVLTSAVQTHDEVLTSEYGMMIGTQALTALPPTAVAHQDFVRLLADEFGRVVTKAFNYSENADDVNVINIDQDRSIEPITAINALTGNNNGTTINTSQYAHHTFNFLVSFAALTAFPDRTVDLVVESSMTANAGEWSTEYSQRFINDINKTVTLEGKSKYMRAATQNADGATVTAYYMGGN